MDDEPSGALRLVYVVAATVAVLAALVEAGVFALVLRRPYSLRQAFVSLVVAAGRRLTDVVPLWLALPFAGWLHGHRLFDVPEDAWWTRVLLFLGLELGHYASHRASHRVRWFWTSHAVHHSSTEMTIAAGYRLGWTGKLTATLVFLSPLAWIGWRPETIAMAYGLALIWQLWLHAAWIPPLGVLEGILNTPSAHRVHHGTNPEYRDKNFGGVTVLFDRLFGTYQPERADVTPVYGWARAVASWSPLEVLVRPWLSLVRDLRAARSARDVALCLVGPPPGND